MTFILFYFLFPNCPHWSRSLPLAQCTLGHWPHSFSVCLFLHNKHCSLLDTCFLIGYPHSTELQSPPLDLLDNKCRRRRRVPLPARFRTCFLLPIYFLIVVRWEGTEDRRALIGGGSKTKRDPETGRGREGGDSHHISTLTHPAGHMLTQAN